MGRPITYKPEEVDRQLNEYINNSSDPYIEEFSLLEGSPCRDTIYEKAKIYKPLSDTIKRCHIKQELRTKRAAEAGTINSTFAIFKLKQKCYGWSDKQEVEHSGEIAMPSIILKKSE